MSAAEQPLEVLAALAPLFPDLDSFERAFAAYCGDEPGMRNLADEALAALPLHQVPARAALPARRYGSLPPTGTEFLGRGAALRTLGYALKTTPALRLMITGMPGIGKTALVVEVALRFGQFFRGGVFVLIGDTVDRLRSELVALGREGLGLRRLHRVTPPDQRQLVAARVARALRILGQAAADDGRDERAALLLGLARRLPALSAMMSAQLMHDEGFTTLRCGRVAAAKGLIEAAYLIRLELHRNRRDASGVTWHQDIAESLVGLGCVALASGELDAAERTLGQAQAILELTLGRDSMECGETMEHRSIAALRLGRIADAEGFLARAASCFTRVFGARPINQGLRVRLRQGVLAFVRGELDAAECAAQEVQRGYSLRGRPTHPVALWAVLLRAEAARRRGDHGTAALLWPAALNRLKALPPAHPIVTQLRPEVALSPLDVAP